MDQMGLRFGQYEPILEITCLVPGFCKKQLKTCTQRFLRIHCRRHASVFLLSYSHCK